MFNVNTKRKGENKEMEENTRIYKSLVDKQNILRKEIDFIYNVSLDVTTEDEKKQMVEALRKTRTRIDNLLDEVCRIKSHISEDGLKAPFDFGNYSVYEFIITKEDGKKKYYIGKTNQKIENRWDNGTAYNKNKELDRDIRAIGFNNIEHYIIKENLLQSEADILETELIQQLREEGKELYNKQKNTESYKKSLGRPVHCDDINKDYETITDAGKDLYISPGNIAEVCNGKRATAGGYHFNYID